MEPYNPNKPFISMKLDGSLLDKMVEAGIPLTRALQYFRDNPEGPASETLNLATDETVPFKWQLRTGNATPASLAEEAVLLAAPMPKGTSGSLKVDPIATKNYNNKLRNMGYPELAEERPLTAPELEYVQAEFPTDPEMANAIVDYAGYVPKELKSTKDAVNYSADLLSDMVLDDYVNERIPLDEAQAIVEDKYQYPGTINDGEGFYPSITDMTVGDFDYLDRATRQELLNRGYTEEAINNVFGEPYHETWDVNQIIEDPNLTASEKRAKIEMIDKNRQLEKAIDDLPDGDEIVKSPLMFRLNPDVPMDMMNKISTKRAIREWNEAVNEMPNNPYPQKIAEPATYDQPILNNLNDAIAKNYKFTPKVRDGGMFWKEDPNIVTEAIIPEDVADAAWLHHNPQMSNYDILFGNKARGIPSTLNTNLKQLINTGNLKSKYPDVDWQYDKKGNLVAKYKTADGGYETTGQRAKSKIADILEKKFPGYKKAMNTPRRNK